MWKKWKYNRKWRKKIVFRSSIAGALVALSVGTGLFVNALSKPAKPKTVISDRQLSLISNFLKTNQEAIITQIETSLPAIINIDYYSDPEVEDTGHSFIYSSDYEATVDQSLLMTNINSRSVQVLQEGKLNIEIDYFGTIIAINFIGGSADGLKARTSELKTLNSKLQAISLEIVNVQKGKEPGRIYYQLPGLPNEFPSMYELNSYVNDNIDALVEEIDIPSWEISGKKYYSEDQAKAAFKDSISTTEGVVSGGVINPDTGEIWNFTPTYDVTTAFKGKNDIAYDNEMDAKRSWFHKATFVTWRYKDVDYDSLEEASVEYWMDHMQRPVEVIRYKDRMGHYIDNRYIAMDIWQKAETSLIRFDNYNRAYNYMGKLYQSQIDAIIAAQRQAAINFQDYGVEVSYIGANDKEYKTEREAEKSILALDEMPIPYSEVTTTYTIVYKGNTFTGTDWAKVVDQAALSVPVPENITTMDIFNSGKTNYNNLHDDHSTFTIYGVGNSPYKWYINSDLAKEAYLYYLPPAVTTSAYAYGGKLFESKEEVKKEILNKVVTKLVKHKDSIPIIET